MNEIMFSYPQIVVGDLISLIISDIQLSNHWDRVSSLGITDLPTSRSSSCFRKAERASDSLTNVYVSLICLPVVGFFHILN